MACVYHRDRAAAGRCSAGGCGAELCAECVENLHMCKACWNSRVIREAERLESSNSNIIASSICCFSLCVCAVMLLLAVFSGDTSVLISFLPVIIPVALLFTFFPMGLEVFSKPFGLEVFEDIKRFHVSFTANTALKYLIAFYVGILAAPLRIKRILSEKKELAAINKYLVEDE